MAEITLDRLGKLYPTGRAATRALEEVSLKIGDGQFVSVVGPSGCGKTTLLNLIAGFERSTSGRVLVDGRPVERPGPDRGVVFQEPGLLPWLSTRENIAIGMRIQGRGKAEIEARVTGLLQAMGLLPFRDCYPFELSGGMRQRVAIARALALDPRVLLMDEPFGALDAMTREIMQELLLRIWEEDQKTVLFVTHDLEEAILLSDLVFIMTARPGRLKREIPVPLPRPRHYSMVTSEVFVKIKAQTLELIREESLRAMREEEGVEG
ncbi:MAG: ABC transporter ATP-binding protein [Deltaproteobacteria bacterium]|nr:ABC transporter ATP-binding protein [Deltaproteobacteria bacterium]